MVNITVILKQMASKNSSH